MSILCNDLVSRSLSLFSLPIGVLLALFLAETAGFSARKGLEDEAIWKTLAGLAPTDCFSPLWFTLIGDLLCPFFMLLFENLGDWLWTTSSVANFGTEKLSCRDGVGVLLLFEDVGVFFGSLDPKIFSKDPCILFF